MKRPTQSAFSLPDTPACLLRRAGILLIIFFLVAGCSAQLPAATQPAPAEAETAAPAATEPLPVATAAPTATLPPSPSATPTSPPPMETPASTDTPLPSLTTEPTTEAATPADTVVPTAATVAATQPAANTVTFQIRNDTDRTVLVYGYGMDKSIPSGLTVYYPAPAWGAISLRVCHKNESGEAGGCYIFYGTITESNPVIVITK